MKYIRHKIKEGGYIELAEEKNGKIHGIIIKPNQPIPEAYKAEIEADENMKYRTPKNAQAYEDKLEAQKPSKKELKAQKEKRDNLKAIREEIKTKKPKQKDLADRIDKLEILLGLK